MKRMLSIGYEADIEEMSLSCDMIKYPNSTIFSIQEVGGLVNTIGSEREVKFLLDILPRVCMDGNSIINMCHDLGVSIEEFYKSCNFDNPIDI